MTDSLVVELEKGVQVSSGVLSMFGHAGVFVLTHKRYIYIYISWISMYTYIHRPVLHTQDIS
jgi:hypothetical protein